MQFSKIKRYVLDTVTWNKPTYMIQSCIENRMRQHILSLNVKYDAVSSV